MSLIVVFGALCHELTDGGGKGRRGKVFWRKRRKSWGWGKEGSWTIMRIFLPPDEYKKGISWAWHHITFPCIVKGVCVGFPSNVKPGHGLLS